MPPTISGRQALFSHYQAGRRKEQRHCTCLLSVETSSCSCTFVPAPYSLPTNLPPMAKHTPPPHVPPIPTPTSTQQLAIGASWARHPTSSSFTRWPVLCLISCCGMWCLFFLPRLLWAKLEMGQCVTVWAPTNQWQACCFEPRGQHCLCCFLNTLCCYGDHGQCRTKRAWNRFLKQNFQNCAGRT